MNTFRVIAGASVAVSLVACGGPLTKDAQNTRVVTPRVITPTTTSRGTDREVESDLRNAFTAEKVTYTDNMMYSAAPAQMKMIEPTLHWGKQLQVSVGDATKPGDHMVVCITETSASGVRYAIADVAAGPNAGTFFGRRGCPARVTAITVSRLASLGVQSIG